MRRGAFTLIEVVVALGILALALAGLLQLLTAFATVFGLTRS